MASAAAAPRAHLTGPSRVPWEGAAGAPAAGDLDCGTQLRSRLIRLPAAARPRVRTSGLPWPLTQIARGRSDIGKAEEYEAIQRETQRELALANVPGVGDLFGGPDQHPPVPTCRPPTPPPLSPHIICAPAATPGAASTPTLEPTPSSHTQVVEHTRFPIFLPCYQQSTGVDEHLADMDSCRPRWRLSQSWSKSCLLS